MSDTSTELAVPAGTAVAGLEDYDPGEDTTSLPRLNIVHADAVFVDSLSGAEYSSLNVILLGLVKQRVLWPAEMGEEGSQPLCKSYNHSQGIPGEGFPAEASGFDLLVVGDDPLNCDSCKLKDWGAHPTRDTPWCSEQLIMPLLMDPEEDGNWVPAVATFQRSSAKPARQYMSSFVRSKQSLFTTETTLSLSAQKRGTVKYSVAKFVKGEPTPEDAWEEYLSNYLSIAEFLRTPRKPDSEETAVTAPSAKAATADVIDATSTEAPAVPSDEAGDDLPF